MKTLYIHIGTPKTGTTAIQHFCNDNRAELKKRGYLYPVATKKYPSVSLVRNGHFLSGYVQGVKPNISENKKIIECGLERILDLFNKVDNVVLSDESIWRTSSFEHDFLWDMLYDFSTKNNFTIKLIIYLRRQDDYIMSIWNQMVKFSGETRSWGTYFEKRKDSIVFDYFTKIKEIENVFGMENIIVRRFDRQLFKGGDIFSDFLSVLGLEWSDKFKIIKQEPNGNLAGNSHEIQRRFNSIKGTSEDEKRLYSSMLQACEFESKTKYKFSMMSKEERKKFLDKFIVGNEKVAKKYIGDGKPMFDYSIPDLPKWSIDNEYMVDDLTFFSSFLMNDMYKELAPLRVKANRYDSIMHPIKFLKRKLRKRR